MSYLLEACSQNAYILKIYGQADRTIKNVSFLDFCLEFAAQLLVVFVEDQELDVHILNHL